MIKGWSQKLLLQVIVLLIWTTLITKLLLKFWVLKVQRLRDQMAQMQSSTVEQIAQLKAKSTSREAEAKRKYDELQLQLKVEATSREVEAAAEATRKYEEL
ncbi:hypothetical protein Gotur_023653 [Gossypium turneri]